MVEPIACSTAAGWEKGQAEQLVQTSRGWFFKHGFGSPALAALSGSLGPECLCWAANILTPSAGRRRPRRR